MKGNQITKFRERVAAVGPTLVPNPVAHPLGPPTVSGPLITVDMMLNQPTRITRMIMDLSLQRFIADRVFASGGGVTGGAVVYDEAVLNELYAARDVEKIAPGTEFPIITSERQVPKVAEVEKWGGKVWISDEARDRNNTAALTNQIRQLTNTIIRKINALTVATLLSSVASSGQTVVGRNWQTFNPNGAAATNPHQGPVRDFALSAQIGEQQELGVNYSLWLVNPQEYAALLIGFGSPTNMASFLSAMNADMFVSNRVPPGEAIVVAGQTTGEMRVEKPLSTETWREQKTERNWIQSSVRPVQYVTNPYAVLLYTGLAG